MDDIRPAKLPEMPKGDAGQPETMREYLKAVPDSSSTLPEKIKVNFFKANYMIFKSGDTKIHKFLSDLIFNDF